MQKFDTPAPVAAVITIPAGRVQLIAADRPDTTVEVRPAAPSSRRDAKAAEQVKVEYGDGVLRVQAPEANRVLGGSGSVEVTVQLPAGSSVEAKAAGADFRTVGRLGDVTFEASRATVKLDEAVGARLAVLAGDVTVGRLAGDAEVSTGKGDIQITEAMGGTVVLRTEDGAIEVGAAAGVSAAMDAGTSYGRISNALKNADGAPGLTIHATTARGDITARSL